VLQGTPLSGVPADPGDDEAIPLARFAELVAAGALDTMKLLWQAHPLMRSANPEARRLLAAILRDYAGRDLARPTPTLAVSLADLTALATPTLVITGAEDTPWRRKVADLLARTLPRAERETIAAAGHACNLCQPAAFNARLTRFFGLP
jgi:pimeloyl-ACP methyl ester carboxylesterase